MRTTLSSMKMCWPRRVPWLSSRQDVGRGRLGLARRALQPAAAVPVMRNGIRLLPVREGARPATLELVNRLRDESP